jgi:hypothetical protein
MSSTMNGIENRIGRSHDMPNTRVSVDIGRHGSRANDRSQYLGSQGAREDM